MKNHELPEVESKVKEFDALSQRMKSEINAV